MEDIDNEGKVDPSKIGDVSVIENNVIESLINHVEALKNIVWNLQILAANRRILHFTLLNIMLDAGMYDYILDAEKIEDAINYKLIVNKKDDKMVLSVGFPGQEVDDILYREI